MENENLNNNEKQEQSKKSLVVNKIKKDGLLFAIIGILSIIFGAKGRKHDENPSKATTGLILGIVDIALWVPLLIFIIWFLMIIF